MDKDKAPNVQVRLMSEYLSSEDLLARERLLKEQIKSDEYKKEIAVSIVSL